MWLVVSTTHNWNVSALKHVPFSVNVCPTPTIRCGKGCFQIDLVSPGKSTHAIVQEGIFNLFLFYLVLFFFSSKFEVQDNHFFWSPSLDCCNVLWILMQEDFAHFVVVFHYNVRSVGLSSLRVGLNNAWYKSHRNLSIYYKVELLSAECYQSRQQVTQKLGGGAAFFHLPPTNKENNHGWWPK